MPTLNLVGNTALPVCDQKAEMYSKNPYTLVYTVTGPGGGVYDLTDHTIDFYIAATNSSGPFIHKTVGAGITITNPTGGVFQVAILITDLQGMEGNFFHEVTITPPAQSAETIATGRIVLHRSLGDEPPVDPPGEGYVLPVTQGGTGLNTIALGCILYASALNTVTAIAPTAANQVLRSTGANALQLAVLQVADIPDLSGTYAPMSKGVTNGDSHDHNGGDGAQIAYANISGTPSLGSAAAKTVGDASGNLQENGAALGASQTVETDGNKKLISAAKQSGYNLAVGTTGGTLADGARGVTNGDSHDHAGGDGAQIDHGGLGGNADDDHSQYLNTARHDTTTRHSLGSVVPHDDHASLTSIGTNTHAQIDTHLAAASPHSGHAIGVASTTDNRVVRMDSTGGKQLQDSLMTIDDSGSPNIPTGQQFKVNGAQHVHAGADISSGTLDGDRLPSISSTKLGGVPATGTPSGKYLKDDASWATPTGGSGDVVGPGSATDNAAVRFDTTTGKLVQNSVVTIDDTTGLVKINAHSALSDPGGSPTGKYAKDDGTWGTPTGTGDVVGPAGATDNAITRYDTATGKLVQNSLATIDDSGSVNIPTGQTYKINSAQHTHDAADVASGRVSLSRLPVGTNLYALKGTGATDPAYGQVAFSEIATGQITLSQLVRGTAGQFIKGTGASDPAYAALAAADIASGRLTAARLLDGTTGYFLKAQGAGNDPVYALLTSTDIPSLDTAKITSGRLTAARLLDAASGFLKAQGVGSDPAYAALAAADLPGYAAGVKGAVLWPASATGLYCKDDGTFAAPSGGSGVRSVADFVVYKVSSTYYAQNGSTGAVDYSGASFLTVMASIYSAVAGATVLLRPGTYDCGSGLPLYGTNYIGGRISGAGRYKVILQASAAAAQGTVDLRTSYFTIDNLTIDGNSQTTTSGLCIGNTNADGTSDHDRASWCTTAQNITVINCSDDAYRFRNNWYYSTLQNCRGMSAISGYGIQFKHEQDTHSWTSGDNGQLTVLNCELDGGLGSIKNTPATGCTCHRVDFIRCGFYGGYNGTYQVDIQGMYGTKFDNCDWEMGASFTSKTGIIIDGEGITLDGCEFSLFANSITAVQTAQSYNQGSVLIHNCIFNYWNSGASAWTSYVTDNRDTKITWHNCTLRADKYGSGDITVFWDYYPRCSNTFVWDDDEYNKVGWSDHFMGSALGPAWTKSGSGTAAMVVDEAGGAIQLETGAVTNQDVALSFNGMTCFDPSKHLLCAFTIKFPTSVTQIEAQVGLRKDANNYMMITVDRPDSGSNAYYYDTCVGGSHTTASMGGWAPNTTTEWTFICDLARGVKNAAAFTAAVVFHLDDTAGSYNRILVSTNLPTSKLEPYIHLKTTDSSTKTMKVRFFTVEQDA